MVVAEVCSSMKYPKRCQYKHAKQKKYHVRNWAEYNEGLRRRGDLTVWFDEEAIANWKADKICPIKLHVSYAGSRLFPPRGRSFRQATRRWATRNLVGQSNRSILMQVGKARYFWPTEPPRVFRRLF